LDHNTTDLSKLASFLPGLGDLSNGVADQVITNLHCKVLIEQKIDPPDSYREKIFELISSA
jgi:hypothetical protein